MAFTGDRILKGLCLPGAIAACLLGALAASGQQTMTADELLARGISSYSQGRFEESTDLFVQFLNDFGKSEEAIQAVQRVKPLLALSYVQTKTLERALPLIEESLAMPRLDPRLAEELTFWKGVCKFDAGDYEDARQSLIAFREQFPSSPKASEAMVLIGTTFLLSEELAGAADYFASIRPKLDGFDRGRVVVLELNSLIASGRLDEAKNLALSEYRASDNILQIVAFQTLLLNLGAQFLDQSRLTDSIACLQHVWTRNRLIKHQRAQLKTLENQSEAEKQRGSDVYRQIRLEQMIGKVRRELDNFQKIESFDAATRMRLARAFQERHRYREAALVLQETVETLPADAMVEQASVNLIQCWLQIGHWKRAIAAADDFGRKFSESKERPLVLCMKGQAQQENHEYNESVETFHELVRNFPEAELAPRAMFMAGFGELQQENFSAALEQFEALPGKYEGSPMVETALYWKGMALSFAKRHEQCRAVMAEYLNQYGKNGRYQGEATFRQAYSAQAMKDYATSIPELETYLREFPGAEENSEALILLGDALMATGEIDKGISRLKQIPPNDKKFFEEGWFKIGKALRLQERYEAVRKHMERFRMEHPKSARIAEAVYWIGWTHLQTGQTEEARKIYWESIAGLGNDPGARGVEDLFRGIRRLYSGENDGIALDARMTQLLKRADGDNQETLATRVLWAQAQQVGKSDPVGANRLYRTAAERINTRSASPVLLADIADSLRLDGETQRARELYRDLLKWNPRAIEKDRAYAGLGLIEMVQGDRAAALEYFERFERQTASSRLFGEIMLAKADLLASENRLEEAAQTINTMLDSPSVSSREKAQALVSMGDLMMKQQKFSIALPYFQRVYVMYGRWRPLVARAYLRSGEAFEALDDKSAAIQTYREMLDQGDLATTPEGKTARERLETLISQSRPEVGTA